MNAFTTITIPWRDLTYAEKIAAVRPLIAVGYSYSKIAEALNCSRQAVAGVINRARKHNEPGFPRKVQPTVRMAHGAKGARGAAIRYRLESARESARLRDVPVPEFVTPDDVFRPLPGSVPCHLIEASPDRCVWPVDGIAGTGTLVCGADRECGSYCAEHHAVAYRGGGE